MTSLLYANYNSKWVQHSTKKIENEVDGEQPIEVENQES